MSFSDRRAIIQFEWTNLDGFNFRDDFFSKEKIDDLKTWASVEQALFTQQPPVPT